MRCSYAAWYDSAPPWRPTAVRLFSCSLRLATAPRRDLFFRGPGTAQQRPMRTHTFSCCVAGPQAAEAPTSRYTSGMHRTARRKSVTQVHSVSEVFHVHATPSALGSACLMPGHMHREASTTIHNGALTASTTSRATASPFNVTFLQKWPHRLRTDSKHFAGRAVPAGKVTERLGSQAPSSDASK